MRREVAIRLDHLERDGAVDERPPVRLQRAVDQARVAPRAAASITGSTEATSPMTPVPAEVDR
jgi:hypothetical protein